VLAISIKNRAVAVLPVVTGLTVRGLNIPTFNTSENKIMKNEKLLFYTVGAIVCAI
jgi:hypothetical protein